MQPQTYYFRSSGTVHQSITRKRASCSQNIRFTSEIDTWNQAEECKRCFKVKMPMIRVPLVARLMA